MVDVVSMGVTAGLLKKFSPKQITRAKEKNDLIKQLKDEVFTDEDFKALKGFISTELENHLAPIKTDLAEIKNTTKPQAQ